MRATSQEVEGDNPVTIVHGPRFETLTSKRPEALAVCAGRIVGTGDLSLLRAAHAGAAVRRVEGAVVIPGLNDAHLHPFFAAEPQLRVDLRPETVADRESALRALRVRAGQTPPGEWVVGAGHDVLHPAGGRLDRRSLDSVSNDHPVYVLGSTWHVAIANTQALERIREHGDPDAAGGSFTRGDDGEPDGWLYERPHMQVAWSGSNEPDLLPALPAAVMADALVAQNRYLNSHGITSYTDALVTPAMWRAYDTLRARGAQSARTAMALWHTYRDLLEEPVLTTGFGDEWLRLVGVKLMYDGALSGGTCLCLEPYAGPAGEGLGIQVLTRAELVDTVLELHRRGVRVLAHANGDAAVGDVLDAIEAAQADSPRPDLRHRIEHCSMTDDAMIDRVARLGVIPVPFAAFIGHHGDMMLATYGEDRAARVARHGSMLAAGIPVAGSSDWPCGPVDALRGLHAMTTRTTTSGRLVGPAERITLREALWVYTVGSAHGTGEERLKGRLAVGQLADFAVLSEDIFVTGGDWVERTQVLSTWVGGTCVWDAADPSR